MKKSTQPGSIANAAVKLQSAVKSEREAVFREIFDYLDGDGKLEE